MISLANSMKINSSQPLKPQWYPHKYITNYIRQNSEKQKINKNPTNKEN